MLTGFGMSPKARWLRVRWNIFYCLLFTAFSSINSIIFAPADDPFVVIFARNVGFSKTDHKQPVQLSAYHLQKFHDSPLFLLDHFYPENQRYDKRQT